METKFPPTIRGSQAANIVGRVFRHSWPQLLCQVIAPQAGYGDCQAEFCNTPAHAGGKGGEFESHPEDADTRPGIWVHGFWFHSDHGESLLAVGKVGRHLGNLQVKTGFLPKKGWVNLLAKSVARGLLWEDDTT